MSGRAVTAGHSDSTDRSFPALGRPERGRPDGELWARIRTLGDALVAPRTLPGTGEKGAGLYN